LVYDAPTKLSEGPKIIEKRVEQGKSITLERLAREERPQTSQSIRKN